LRLYGGHRIWVASEELPRSYHPDNSPVELSYDSEGIVVRGEAEARNVRPGLFPIPKG